MNESLPPPRFGEADLSDCDREPIHVPGSIQPHGCLLAVDRGGRVVHAAGDLLDATVGDPLGRHLVELVGEDAARRILSVREMEAPQDAPLRAVELGIETGAGKMDAAVHESEGLLVVELEPAGRRGDPGETINRVHRMLQRIEQVKSLEAFLETSAQEVRRLTGFDRVMVYRFLEDGSGTVAAEDREETLESFLHLRYPASDIPQQARALYLRNRLRLIPNVDCVPAPIRPPTSAQTDRPLDLTFSTLRSVSPIHLQYLRNLGVTASMSISIVMKGALWGMIVCHHGTVRHLPYGTRQACDLFAKVFSLQLEGRLAAEGYEERLAWRAVHERLMANLSRTAGLAEGLAANLALLRELVPSCGVATLVEGHYAALGDTPDRLAADRLATFLGERGTDTIFATDRLGELFPDEGGLARAGVAGMLAVCVSATPRDYIFWFRPELVETVTWAGDPNKSVTKDDAGALTPRASFAAWRETVRGSSAPFRTMEMEAAEALRLSILEVVVRRIEELSRERAAAQERQGVLIAELDHRVKNILANVEALMRHTRLSSADLDGYVAALESRIKAMAHAQSLLSESRWRSASLKRLLREELDPYSDDSGRVILEGQDVALAPKAALALAMVLHELATNTAKHGALSCGTGRLSLAWHRDGEGLRIAWREFGGPAVRPPTRRGFGRTLIERSLGYELGGAVQLRFPPAGVECDLFVPAAFLTEERTSPLPDTPPRVLVLEDSMIFAFDLEERVRALGCEVVGPTGRLEEAMAIAAHEPLDLAVLDVNLGDRDSFAVADLLIARAVPFLFLTGYDARMIMPPRFSHVPCLSKPVNDADLADAVRRLLAVRAGRTGGEIR